MMSHDPSPGPTDEVRAHLDGIRRIAHDLPPERADVLDKVLQALRAMLGELEAAGARRTRRQEPPAAYLTVSDELVLQAILRRLPVGIEVVEAPSGRLILRNAYLARFWRMPAGEGNESTGVGGCARYHGYHADGRPYRPDEWPLSRAVTTGAVVDREEIEVELANGMRGTVEVSAAPIRDREGRILAAAAIFHDISDRMQAERARQALARERAARTAAEETEARYRAWFQHGADAVLMMNERGRLIDANQAATRLLDSRRDELLGRQPWLDGLIVGEPSVVAEGYATLERDGRWDGELLVRRKDGTAVPIESRTVRIDLPSGFVYRGNWRDITDRKAAEAERERLLARAQEAETRYRHLFEGTADAVLAADADGRLLDANRAALVLLGYTIQELGTLHVTGIFRLEGGSAEQELRQVVARGSWEGDGEAIKKDGRTVPVEMRASRIDLPTGPACVVVAHDISHRRMLDRMRDEFVALVTRELRTPVDSLRGFASHLKDGNRFDEAAVDGILAQADHLYRLVGDLLDNSALAAGALRLNRTPRDLVALTRKAIRQTRVIHPACTMRIVATRPSIVGRWDPDRLAQVLDDVLEHAARYGAPGREILVRLETQSDAAHLTVVTPGSTLPAHELPRVFERFNQPAPRGGRIGFDSGLYIARKLIEAHGGRVWTGSNAAGDTTIDCSLPFEPPPETASPRGPLTPRQLEIAALVAQGLTNAQIAERLVLTEGTVANHIVNALRRLSFHSRAQIAAWASARGLVPPHLAS